MIKPDSELALVTTIKEAKGPMRVIGGGTRIIGAPAIGEILSTTGMSGISLYEPGALTIVAASGTPVAEIEAKLAKDHQRLAFEPMDHRELLGTQGTPTIGGVVATNASGPRRIQVGACRDSLLGVRFVDGQGRSLKNGGRVMKNVTGYDLVKLMAGSWGTLGVLSEVSLKVQAIPEAVGCVLVNGLDETAAVSVMSRALGSPYDVSGAAHAPVGVNGHPVTMIRVEGLESSVSYRTKKLRQMFADNGVEITIEHDLENVTACWKWVRDVSLFKNSEASVWRISIKPTDAPGLVARIRADYHDVSVLYDWGGGLIWIEAPEGANLRSFEFSGHATLIRKSPDTLCKLPIFQPNVGPLLAISKGLRSKFDPRNILNPGLMG